jgi:hypothetical protein
MTTRKAKRIEPHIYRRRGGGLFVRVPVNGVNHSVKCEVLSQARAERARLLAMRETTKKPSTAKNPRWSCKVRMTDGSVKLLEYAAKNAGAAAVMANNRSDVLRVLFTEAKA